MKFSVITVSYNHAEFIRQTIESVLAQNYPDFEHLVIDGGSTDGTLDILKEYPHLRWISEPDRGQSHALNKGFRMATGDVICWLNSDDWYPPNTFEEVAKCIGEHAVVIGASTLTHRDGTPYETRGNFNRGWFDILKNWVYHSSPDQPSVFFRRHILEEFPLPNGDFIDESLHFAMDYDWWLRIGITYPLAHYVPKSLSYIRVYDTAKTGAHMASVYREMSRVFRRHESARIGVEQNVSVIIPVSGALPDLDLALSNLNSSPLSRVEVLIADGSREAGTQRKNRRSLLDLEERFPRLLLRHVGPESSSDTEWSAIHAALLSARSPISIVIDRHAKLAPHALLEIARIFEHDNIALVLPNSLFATPNANGVVTAPAALGISSVKSGFAVRTLAYLEVMGSGSPRFSHLHVRTLTARLIHKAWLALSSELLGRADVDESGLEKQKSFGLYTNAALVDEFRGETSSNLFASLRAKNGFALQIPDDLWNLARRHLEQAPEDWTSIQDATSEDHLRDIIRQRPNFGPARLLLYELLERRGDNEAARSEKSAYDQIASQEKQSPLYS